jgi:hypothetical protein
MWKDPLLPSFPVKWQKWGRVNGNKYLPPCTRLIKQARIDHGCPTLESQTDKEWSGKVEKIDPDQTPISSLHQPLFLPLISICSVSHAWVLKHSFESGFSGHVRWDLIEAQALEVFFLIIICQYSKNLLSNYEIV